MRIDPHAVLSRPGSGGDDAPLLVLLHGLGSDERDMFSFAPLVPPAFRIASLRAPLPWGAGWAWYPVTAELSRQSASAAAAAEAGAAGAASAVLAWIDDAVGPQHPVGLVGFSQGASLALQVLRSSPARFGFAVALAGFLASATLPGDEELRARRPPLLLGRGEADAVIPVAESLRLEAWAAEHAEVEEHRYPGLGHGVSEAELADTVRFLGARLHDRT